MSSEERRAPGMTRMPFEGMVEVGGALGPSFEATAVNVSEDGMLMRTAYLPEPGQPLTCRFDSGPGQSVLASGEVVWTHGAEKGGEFAIRFTDMDAESVDSLKKLCGLEPPMPPAQVGPGAKVRLHIEGLASPMRAKIKDSGSAEVTVGSDLGFLQVGKQLELEDAGSGQKRPAAIDRVEVQVDPSSHVPQLVVTLRYADAAATGQNPAQPAPREKSPAAAKDADDLAAVEEASQQMKGAVARNIARIGPAMERLASRAKTTIALLAARKSLAGNDEAAAPRRTTAPAPGGGLHASGKRVVRGEPSLPAETPAAPPRLKLDRRTGAIAGAVMIAAILGALALKKTHHDASDPTATAAPEGSSEPATATTAAAAPVEPAATAPAALPFPPQPAPPPTFEPQPTSMGAAALADDTSADESKPEHHKHVKVTPFGNGPVHHGNVLHLKMDGAIESLEGAQQPTGFAVKIPGRRSLEAAAPLAARDSRIAAIKVSNDSAGAELTVAFKDGVPNYLVTAHGDTLTIALAPAGDLDKVASKDDKGSKSGKHGKHEKDHEKDKSTKPRGKDKDKN